MQPRKKTGKKRLGRVLPWAVVATATLLSLVVLDATVIEPNWLKVRTITLAENPTVRIAHISDIHFTGDGTLLEKAVQAINEGEPDLVCFTGDLIEHRDEFTAAVEILRQIDAPLFGVPGNHDYHSRFSFARMDAALREGGGRWLTGGSVETMDGRVTIVGLSGHSHRTPETPGKGKTILLCHYPDVVGRVADGDFDLILAGHSHGGQVRLPFVGAMVLPGRVGPYEKGLYRLPGGDLHVSPGIGTFRLPVRLLCRPEVTFLEF